MRRRLSFMLLLLAVVALVATTGTTPSATAGDDAAAVPGEGTVQSRWGWSQGRVGAGLSDALAPVDPIAVALPDPVASQVTGPTALLYFSPTCPHCRHAMPELNALAALQPDLAWLGIASGSSTQAALDEFTSTFGVQFPMVIDTDRGFAWATGARSTPSLLLVEPAPAGTPPASGDDVKPGTTVVMVTEAWMPYSRGLAPVIAMRRNAMGRTGPDGAALPPDVYRDFHGYQGTRACAACHADEATSWALTHHAGAYPTLYDRERAEDLACVGCHVTGFTGGTDGTPPAFAELGGFQLGDHSSPLADVGCEACHGPAGPHDGDPTATPAGGGVLDSCVGCHDAKHSVAFSVEKGAPHIDHYAAVGMEPDALRARLDALAEGTAARPLLAFPTGPTAGADACRSCHKKEHKGWSGHAHADAMDTLGDDAGNAECVACHATARSYGGMGAQTDLAAFRTDEGVGCEACHGPGQAHVDDPTRDNIVHLGESCPECVLEGICTSCHNPKWDPTWDLQTRLKALPYGD